MKHIIFPLLFLCVLSMSCSEQKFDANNNSEKIYSLKLSESPDYQPHKRFDAIEGDYDGYLEYFRGTDYEIGISSCKNGGLPGGSAISCISGTSQIQKSAATKASVNELPQIKSFVDGMEISQNNLASTKAQNGIMNCFGKVVKFTFSSNDNTKSSDSNEEEVDMYVPEVIEFLFPHAESAEDLNPLCYYQDFIVRWNKDENNENGVIVVVDWDGSMVLGKTIPDTHVCTASSFPDTGEAKLSEKMFDGIPDTALCDIMILRGNVENIEQGQYSYKLVGKTHHLISFVLIREIKY